jgi:hypothetical protein
VRGAAIAIGIIAALVAAVPLAGYPFASGSRIDPYRNRVAKWAVYVGALVALACYIILSRGG